jgi:hypothetical protein
VRIGPKLGLPLAFDLSVPLTQDTFRFDSIVFHSIGGICVGGTVAIAVSFW